MKISRIAIFLILTILPFASSQAQLYRLPSLDSVEMLLTNVALQSAITDGIDDMYNFEFARAESQFLWLKKNYPDHPLPYFLMGLSQWWKMMPNTDITTYDEAYYAYMDSTLLFAEKRFKEYPEDSGQKLEAAFFISGANAFIGRLESERKNWAKAAVYGKRALNYLDFCKGKGTLSPELLFGDALFNYYSDWIRENYKYLRPMMWFFAKGDMELGLAQLEEVVRDAFYTKVEAQYFLMRIYAYEEKETKKALLISEYLHGLFPNNPYFHRHYARMLYTLGSYYKLEEECLEILQNIEDGKFGYEGTSGRYAGFFLGVYYELVKKDTENAIAYYQKAISFSEQAGDLEAGYYLHSLANMGALLKKKGDYEAAMLAYEKILENADRKHSARKKAKAFQKEYKQWKRSKQ